jgi:hypothetical protein
LVLEFDLIRKAIGREEAILLNADHWVSAGGRSRHAREGALPEARVLGGDGFGDEVWEENSLWYCLVVEWQRLRVAKGSCSKAFVLLGSVSMYVNSRCFVNYPG